MKLVLFYNTDDMEHQRDPLKRTRDKGIEAVRRHRPPGAGRP